MNTHRRVCLRCRRPESVCYCSALARVDTQTRVVFLQHPRETKVAVGTCRMAHLSLPNSELHVGVDFSDNPQVNRLAADKSGKTVLLFPRADAVLPEALPTRPENLIVVDGTWSQAAKLIHCNPQLLSLPKVALKPSRPGNYRIRQEPEEHCLATIEAVVEVLTALEGRPESLQALIKTFDRMVEYQLAHMHLREGPSRHKRARHRQVPRKSPVPQELQTQGEHLVLVYAEANAHPAASEAGAPELVHLLAQRPFTKETFEAVIAPRRRLSPSAPRHLELAEEALLKGEPIEKAMDRWRAFLSPKSILVTWGRYPIDLLNSENAPTLPVVDLRFVMSQKLNQKPGGVEDAAQRMSPTPPMPWTKGRAARRLACVERVLEVLRHEAGPAVS